MKSSAGNTSIQINVSNLPAGVYIVRIMTENNVAQQKLLNR